MSNHLPFEFIDIFDRGHAAGYQQAQRDAEADKHSFKAWCETIGNAGFFAFCIALGFWLGMSGARDPVGEAALMLSKQATETAEQMTVRVK